MITKIISALVNYPSEHFQKAFLHEVKNIFKNRLVETGSLAAFEDILQSNTQHLFPHDNSTYFFVPTGAKSSDLSIVLNEEWSETVGRNLTICGKAYSFFFFATH